MVSTLNTPCQSQATHHKRHRRLAPPTYCSHTVQPPQQLHRGQSIHEPLLKLPHTNHEPIEPNPKNPPHQGHHRPKDRKNGLGRHALSCMIMVSLWAMKSLSRHPHLRMTAIHKTLLSPLNTRGNAKKYLHKISSR